MRPYCTPSRFAIFSLAKGRWYSARTVEEALRLAKRHGGSILGPGFGCNGTAAQSVGCGR
jgi:hypothetical protein